MNLADAAAIMQAVHDQVRADGDDVEQGFGMEMRTNPLFALRHRKSEAATAEAGVETGTLEDEEVWFSKLNTRVTAQLLGNALFDGGTCVSITSCFCEAFY